MYLNTMTFICLYNLGFFQEVFCAYLLHWKEHCICVYVGVCVVCVCCVASVHSGKTICDAPDALCPLYCLQDKIKGDSSLMLYSDISLLG